MKRTEAFTTFTNATTAHTGTVYHTERACGMTAVFKVVIATTGTVDLNTYVSQDNSTFVLHSTATVTATGNTAVDIPCRNYKYVKIATANVTTATTSCTVNIAAKGTELPGPAATFTALAATTTASSTTYTTDNAVDMQVAWTNVVTGGGGAKNVISGSNDGTNFAVIDTATLTATLNRTVNIDLATKPYKYIKIATTDVTTTTTTATAKITSHIER